MKTSPILKDRICSIGSKFSPLRVDRFIEGTSGTGKQTGSNKSYLPCKFDENKNVSALSSPLKISI